MHTCPTTAAPGAAQQAAARRLISGPRIGHLSPQMRLAAWAILKSARGQSVIQHRLRGGQTPEAQ